MIGWWATLTDAERAAVLLMLAPDDEFMFRQVGMGMLSLARYSGAAMVNGKRFTYMREHDELVRDDVLKLVESLRKAQRKADKAAAKAAQRELL